MGVIHFILRADELVIIASYPSPRRSAEKARKGKESPKPVFIVAPVSISLQSVELRFGFGSEEKIERKKIGERGWKDILTTKTQT